MAKSKTATAPAETEEEKKTGTDIVESKTTQIIPSIEVADEALLAEMQGVEGAGVSDNVEDRGVPLLYIVQKNSPQIDKKKLEKFIKEAEVGNCFNNLTNELFDAEGDGIPILPCYFRMNWNEWTPRDDGGGFHGSHPRDTPLLRNAKQWVDPEDPERTRRDIFVMPNGHELRLTAHYFCILEHSWEPIIVPMASTNLTASRKLQTMIGAQKIQAGSRIVVKPAFFTTFNLKTVYKDDGNNQWYAYTPSIVGPTVNPALREFAKQFAIACNKNEVKMAAADGEGEVDGPAPGKDDIPV